MTFHVDDGSGVVLSKKSLKTQKNIFHGLCRAADDFTIVLLSFTGTLLLTVINKISIRVRAWMKNDIYVTHWDVITNPYPNFNDGLVKIVYIDGYLHTV